MQIAVKHKTSFSRNWNGKLSKGNGVRAFTTIRLHNPKKYFQGAIHSITLKGEELGDAKVEHVKTIMLSKIDSYTAWLDTGYNAEGTRTMLKNMYKNIGLEDDFLVDVVLMIYE